MNLGNQLTLGAHQELEFHAQRSRRFHTVIHIGGVGSGKTLVLVLWLLDRSKWDTGQEQALFTYTAQQRDQVLQRVYPWLEACGVRHVFNRRPPQEWVDRWEREGIPQPPPRDRYVNAITLSTGLRIQTGTLFNLTFEQFKSAEWGSIAIEEFTAGPTQTAVEWVMDRVRCGAGVEVCTDEHVHTSILHGNPPEDDDSWTFDWLSGLQAKSAALPGGVAAEDEDSYPSLMRGVGPILYIESSSEDNPHTGTYAQRVRDRIDEDTAERRLGGKMRRRRTGRAYWAFSRENEHAIGYHRDRTIYVTLDFNNRPIAAGLWHPLNPGEYPSEHRRPDIRHIGKFGEIFDTKGGGLEALCSLLLSHEVGDKGAAPRDPSCDHTDDETCSCWRGLMEHRGPVVFYGDGTGLNKTARGPSLWKVVDDIVGRTLRALNIRYSRKVSANPAVHTRVRAYNAKLCSASGLRSAWIDPRCSSTITDLMTVVWEASKNDVQKYGERGGGNKWLLTHLTDGDGYFFETEFPMGREAMPLPPKTEPRRLEIPNF